MGKAIVPERAVPWPAPAADDTPVMAAVAADLGGFWLVLEQARELLGVPGGQEKASERART